MITLDAPVWQTLSSAGNDADKWLRCLLAGEGDLHENIQILAEDISHQLSYYSATAYVLPHLAAFCHGLSPKDKVFLIAQMGAAIAAEADCPLSPGTEPFREFEEGLAGLCRETQHLLTDPALPRLLGNDPDLGQQFALAALAILGNRKHALAMNFMSGSCWEEVAIACSCGWNDETYCFSDEPTHLKPAEIDTWDGNSLTDEAVWFHGLLALAEEEDISPILPYVYGDCVCPACGRQEPFWNFFDRFYEEY